MQDSRFLERPVDTTARELLVQVLEVTMAAIQDAGAAPWSIERYTDERGNLAVRFNDGDTFSELGLYFGAKGGRSSLRLRADWFDCDDNTGEWYPREECLAQIIWELLKAHVDNRRFK